MLTPSKCLGPHKVSACWPRSIYSSCLWLYMYLGKLTGLIAISRLPFPASRRFRRRRRRCRRRFGRRPLPAGQLCSPNSGKLLVLVGDGWGGVFRLSFAFRRSRWTSSRLSCLESGRQINLVQVVSGFLPIAVRHRKLELGREDVRVGRVDVGLQIYKKNTSLIDWSDALQSQNWGHSSPGPTIKLLGYGIFSVSWLVLAKS